MKISQYTDKMAQTVQQYQKVEQAPVDAAKRVNGAPTPQEQVELSTKAKEIQQIKGILTGLPEIREDKVQDLKERISAGTYRPDAGKIADRMVGESLLDIFA